MGRFDYVKYDDTAALLQLDMKAQFEAVERAINRLEEGRAKALALSNLEVAYAWCGKAIRDEQFNRTGSIELQEGRGHE